MKVTTSSNSLAVGKAGAALFCKGKSPVLSLTGYFAIPLGGVRICIIYDISSLGLNKALRALNFVLNITQEAELQGWIGDLEIRELFLNFSSHGYSGVDVKPCFLT